jgi:uncharacterized membrane protein YfcA
VAKIVYYSATLWALSRAEVTALALAAPFSVLGSRLGHRILVRLSNETFRAGTVWLVTAVGAFFFVQGVWMLATR